jgi:hypothetical protein
MRQKNGPQETGPREADQAKSTDFLRSQFWEDQGNTLLSYRTSFPAPLSVTPLFELRRM